jgi:lysophospholipase L1-like esterase
MTMPMRGPELLLSPLALALAAALAAGPALAQPSARPTRTDAPPITADKVVLVGDSTVAPHSGWGAAFCARHVKSSVACLNLGRGGRSTRSYVQEGSWAIALAEARTPGYRRTYVLIQFGHNDQSDRPERWTDLETEFPANLRRYVADVREAGAIPILVTPLVRRQFLAGELRNTLEPWSEAVRRVAGEEKVALVDLNRRSAELTRQIGPAAATAFAQLPPSAEELAAAQRGTTLPPAPAPAEPAPNASALGPRGAVMRKFDYTHLGDRGAAATAALVAYDLALAAPELSAQLLP